MTAEDILLKTNSVNKMCLLAKIRYTKKKYNRAGRKR